ncbi:MAG: hypothetical protein J0L92_23710 [Deltaproteobacteria bacterium]|nr:hypothetical protein [Deltaproteobacteria bacterium]
MAAGAAVAAVSSSSSRGRVAAPSTSEMQFFSHSSVFFRRQDKHKVFCGLNTLVPVIKRLPQIAETSILGGVRLILALFRSLGRVDRELSWELLTFLREQLTSLHPLSLSKVWKEEEQEKEKKFSCYSFRYFPLFFLLSLILFLFLSDFVRLFTLSYASGSSFPFSLLSLFLFSTLSTLVFLCPTLFHAPFFFLVMYFSLFSFSPLFFTSLDHSLLRACWLSFFI